MRPYKIILRFLALVIVAFGGMAAWLATSLPWTGGDHAIGGLAEPVEILRDENGVPHIFAEVENDAYFGLSLVHAQDRFWQMEMMRRLGAGRLAEVLGPDAVASDKWMRTLGLYGLAEKMLTDVSPAVRKALEAYARGVNYWLKEDMGLLAPEFALFRYTPEPWKPADSLVWGKIMAARLGGNWRGEALRARLAKKLAPGKVRELWPAYPKNGEITVAGLAPSAAAALFAGLDGLPPWPADAPKGASNAWALGEGETDSGAPILANDPHLGFSAPIMWYLARMETPTYKFTGATVPGVPFAILGQTRKHAWGMTSTQSDIEDLFVEKIDANEPDRYVTPDGSRAFFRRDEVIRVDGAADVKLTVRTTRHGPVISDLREDLGALVDKDHVVALAATYLQPGDTSPDAFFQLSRAIHWDGFKQALARLQAPQQNFIYADTDGLIGFMTAGKAPMRARGLGFVPTNGWTGDTDWTGFVPVDELPESFNPDGRRLFNANNRVAGDGYGHFLGVDWAPPFRAARIKELLAGGGGKSVKAAQAMQRDAVSRMAQYLLPLMLTTQPEAATEKRAVALLRNWDGAMLGPRPEPLIFSAWLLALNRALYGDELGQNLNRFLGARPLAVRSMLTRRTAWCDDVRTEEKTETCADMLGRSLKVAVKVLSDEYGTDPAQWRWDAAHVAHFPHPVLTHVPVLHLLADLRVATDGGNATLNRGAMRLADPKAPFKHVHGAGYRAVYDLQLPRRSRFAIATGQSGNPLSLKYRSFLNGWARGQYVNLGQTRRSLQANYASRMMLNPAKGKK